MTTSTAQGIDTFGGPATNIYPQNFQAGNGLNNVPTFRIIAKNVRGLKTDERILELIDELKMLTNWDILVLNETWRLDGFEMFATDEGHLFCNAGCEAGRRGVGFLVHKRWTKWLKGFTPVSERVACLTLQKQKMKIKIVGVYFPHSGYPDDTVQELYDKLECILYESRASREHVVITGDFNAEIGTRRDIDNQRLIGPWSVGDQNYRGFWLKRWCELNELTVANTLFPKRRESIITYIGPNKHERQIDFALVTKKTRRILRNCGSTREVDMNSDHFAVEIILDLTTQKKKKRKLKQRRNAKLVSWKNVDLEQFGAKTDELVQRCDFEGDLQARCEQVERILLDAANNAADNVAPHTGHSTRDEVTRELMERRRAMKTGTAEKKEISKLIQKRIRQVKREMQHEKVAEALGEFRDLKRIPRIKTVKKRKLIVQMVDRDGNCQTDRKAIADIFADFYEQLYSCAQQEATEVSAQTSTLSPFTLNELILAVKSLKRNRCADTTGIRAEMLKVGGKHLLEKMLELYNTILTGNMEPPASWSHSVISVIHKSGDATQPQNYRPISIIPMLYKLFSKLLYRRLYPILDGAQCKDQAGFRKNYSTIDHTFVFSMLYEKSEEFNLNTWIAAIDFKKAFDSIDQEYLWKALKEQNVPSGCIRILRSLYAGQSAQVKTDVLSRNFGIHRGTKQGDPLSSLLFNALLERVMTKVKPSFVEKKYGVQMGLGSADSKNETRLTNLRFADDVLVVGSSLKQVTEMLQLLQAETGKCGLELHPEKTKIISSTNRQNRPRNKYTHVGDMKIEILARTGTLKYLGRQITFNDAQRAELSNRIRGAWAKFMEHKDELTKKTYALSDRLRLFDAVVSPAVLYGSETWTLTKEMERALRTTQRRMLRAILGQNRRRIQEPTERTTPAESEEEGADDVPEEDSRDELEPWVEWIKRVTHNVENNLKRLKIRTWVEQARKRKWKFAAELYSGSGERKWTHLALEWNPQVHHDTFRPTARRNPTRPNLRWTDELHNFVKKRLSPARVWNEVCPNPDFWIECEDQFVNENVN